MSWRNTDCIYEGKHEVGLSFGQAIEAMKAGKRCGRAGWNNHQYIEIATNISYKDSHGDIINVIGNPVVAFVDIYGVQLGWIASQADMLANDWQVVE